jgi:hypothetical protein
VPDANKFLAPFSEQSSICAKLIASLSAITFLYSGRLYDLTGALFSGLTGVLAAGFSVYNRKKQIPVFGRTRKK